MNNYVARRFDDIYNLRDFLNLYKIPPQNIISVVRQNSANGYGCIEILYVVEAEEVQDGDSN